MKEPLTIQITIDEANLILSALGNLSYMQVHQLIHSLQSQIGPQLVDLDKSKKPSTNGKEIKTALG